MGAGADRLDELDHVFYVVVEAKAAVFERHVAGVVPVGDVDVMVLQQGAGGFAQQGGEMAGQRRHQQHRRVVAAAGDRFFEVEQAAEGQGEHHVFLDRRGLAVHHHRAYAVGRPGVGQAHA